VLIWARADESTWLVIQVFRHSPEEPWQRSLSYRERVAPLKRLRPGEDPGGTWHAMQRFTNTPTVHELCAFAAVSFLQAPAPSWRTVAAQWDFVTWRAVAGGVPPCGFTGGTNSGAEIRN
jgi:hypothetical protein